MKYYNVNVLKNIKDFNMDDVRDISSVFEKIKSGVVRRQIDLIRWNTYKDIKNILKEQLPSFTVSATFNDRRIKENIKDYNGLIHLDYDGVDNPEQLKDEVSKLETTYCAFISPSGNGLKVFIKTNGTLEYHESSFNQLRKIYDTYVGIESDRSVKDVTRLCYASNDPYLYLNNNSIVFDVIEYLKPKETTQQYTPEYIFNYTSNIFSFASGSRNVFTYTYGCNSNKYGINENEAIEYISKFSEPDFTYNEIEKTVKNAYTRNSSEFATLQHCNTATFETDSVQSPFISDEIYDNLPSILKEACSHFEARERDVFFISSITVLSGFFSNITGAYDKKIVNPCLYAFIVANAASGKSAAKYAKVLGQHYHNMLKKTSEDAMKEYKKAKFEFDKKKKAKNSEGIEEPEKPNRLMFFIPGDASEASLVGHIKENEGKGCIFETEADTISGANKQEWGGFSHVLRKNFHHEDISRTRKTDDEFTEISNSRFSFLTTGTPDQVKRLIPTSVDGLYSRFLFYVFSIPYKWRSTFTQEIGDSMDVILSELGQLFYSKYKNEEERTFTLTPSQGKKHDDTFENLLEQMKIEGPLEEVIGVLFRHGLMTYKIAMILSALESTDKKILCTDRIYDLSLKLVLEVFLDNALDQLKRMPKSTILSTSKHEKLFNSLPKEFYRKKAIDLAKEIGVSQRSADGYLKILQDQGRLIRQKHGSYRKS
ncbi:DUF3987 domain-containing protein [Flavobacteriaceae bacterium]|nr:DUF3987 domain-containing protein [Flavobacteriaceae bacterium]